MTNTDLIRLRRIAVGVATRFGLKRHAAEDIAQRTLLALLEAEEPPHSPTSWVFTVARRNSSAFVRKEARYVIPGEVDISAKGPTSDERIDLKKALFRLDHEERNVWLRRNLEDSTVDEVSLTMGISESTVKRRTRRSQARLERYFA